MKFKNATKLDLATFFAATVAMIGLVICFMEPPHGWRIPVYFVCALTFAGCAVYVLYRMSSTSKSGK